LWDSGRFVCKDGYENYPVVYVSWLGAVAYCEWLSEKTGRSVRLPNEVEWQYAALGPRGLKWGLSDTFDPDGYICGRDGPAPVDCGQPSEWGLFNITGNVFEWCADEYGFALANDRKDNRLRQNRVIKGGAFILRDSANFRNAKRFSCHQQSCLFSLGFRVAASIDE
jgi:formylglycine-generating enzyme required for sulfatase activity